MGEQILPSLCQRPNVHSLAPPAALFLLVMLVSAPLSAQPKLTCEDDYIPPEHRDDAMALTLKGIACFEATSYAQALTYYRRAYAISPSPLLDAAIGRSMHELGMWGAARAYYQRYLSRGDAEGRGKIEERLSELERQLAEEAATLSLTSSPQAARVFLLGESGHTEDLGVTPMTTRLAPGKYTILFEASGFYASQKIALLSPKEADEVDAELVPQGATFNIEARRVRRIGATTMLISAPIAIAGGVLSITGKPENRPFGYGMVFIGGTGLLAGGVVKVLGYRRDGAPSVAPAPEKEEKNVFFSPLFSRRSIGLRVQW